MVREAPHLFSTSYRIEYLSVPGGPFSGLGDELIDK